MLLSKGWKTEQDDMSSLTNTPFFYQISIFRLECLDFDLNRVQASFRAKIYFPAYDG